MFLVLRVAYRIINNQNVRVSYERTRVIVFCIPVFAKTLSVRLFRFFFPVWRALKWSCPSRRFIILPVLVSLKRFEIDFFVLIFGIKKIHYSSIGTFSSGREYITNQRQMSRYHLWVLFFGNNGRYFAPLLGDFLFKSDREFSLYTSTKASCDIKSNR